MSMPQKRPGRRRIHPDQRATERMTLAVTISTRDRVEALAIRYGWTMSEILRHGLELALKELDPDTGDDR